MTKSKKLQDIFVEEKIPKDLRKKIPVIIENNNIIWVKTAGDNTGLKGNSAQWVTFGSSFNVLDRDQSLRETHRLLKKNGFFTCMWNHRQLHDPIQKKAEDIIITFIPQYSRGVRREELGERIKRGFCRW